MSAVTESNPNAGRSQEFELNLAPIVDCFTVLITFMLVSASFISIGILEAFPNAAAQASTDSTAPRESLQLELRLGGSAEIQISGPQKINYPIAAKEGMWNQEVILQTLQGLKTKFPQIQSLTLSAQNEVEYVHVIRWMETLHPFFGQIRLGGF
jgi:hypothetical protein